MNTSGFDQIYLNTFPAQQLMTGTHHLYKQVLTEIEKKIASKKHSVSYHVNWLLQNIFCLAFYEVWHFTISWNLSINGTSWPPGPLAQIIMSPILNSLWFAVPLRHGSKNALWHSHRSDLIDKWELLSAKTFKTIVPEVLTVVINYEDSCFQMSFCFFFFPKATLNV